MTYAAGKNEWAAAAEAPLDDSLRIRWAFCLIAAMIAGFCLMASPNSLLRDPDNWWHVKVGLDLLSSHTFPTVDTYSHTFAGQPWIAKEWLGQILLALAYQAGGWSGVALLTICAVALTVLLLAWHFSAALKPTAAVGLTLLLALLIGSLFNARPIVFTFPIMVVWTAQLFDAAREERAPPLWLLPLLCLWANLHAAFTFGFVIAFFAGLDLLERTRLSKPKLLGQWIGFGVLCPLVCLIHPYGVKAILATLSVARGNEAVALIGEWQPFNAPDYMVQEAGLLLAFFALMVARPRIGWAKALFFILALHLFLGHIRFLYLPLLLAPIAISHEIAAQYPRLSARVWATEARDALERLLALRFRAVVGALGVLTIAVAAFVMTVIPVAPAKDTSAEGAIAYAREHGLSAGNVLNSYNLGGTLVFNGIKTFIDGRTDQLFLGGFMKRDHESGTSKGKPVLAEELKTYAIDWALLVKDDPRIPFFDEMAGWRRAYADAETVIYARDK